jgi:hypothetical protein
LNAGAIESAYFLKQQPSPSLERQTHFILKPGKVEFISTLHPIYNSLSVLGPVIAEDRSPSLIRSHYREPERGTVPAKQPPPQSPFIVAPR